MGSTKIHSCTFLFIQYFETSAKEAINIEQAFYTIAKNAMQREQQVEIYRYFLVYDSDFPDPIRIDGSEPVAQQKCECQYKTREFCLYYLIT